MPTVWCPDSVLGFHGLSDRYGRCPWCKQKTEYVVVWKPKAVKSDIDLSYEYFYDPDFGSKKEDKY